MRHFMSIVVKLASWESRSWAVTHLSDLKWPQKVHLPQSLTFPSFKMSLMQCSLEISHILPKGIYCSTLWWALLVFVGWDPSHFGTWPCSHALLSQCKWRPHSSLLCMDIYPAWVTHSVCPSFSASQQMTSSEMYLWPIWVSHRGEGKWM